MAPRFVDPDVWGPGRKHRSGIVVRVNNRGWYRSASTKVPNVPPDPTAARAPTPKGHRQIGAIQPDDLIAITRPYGKPGRAPVWMAEQLGHVTRDEKRNYR